jgi:hypothetical protein
MPAERIQLRNLLATAIDRPVGVVRCGATRDPDLHLATKS